jgi:hypothetical protein
MNHEIPLIVNVAVALAIASPAGLAIGPFTPGFVGNHAQIPALADVGVIFLMFGLGSPFAEGPGAGACPRNHLCRTRFWFASTLDMEKRDGNLQGVPRFEQK